MQTLEGGKTRFAAAQEKVRELIADLGVAGKAELYLTTPTLERLHGSPRSASEAAGAVAGLAPYDLADPAIDYEKILHQLAASVCCKWDPRRKTCRSPHSKSATHRWPTLNWRLRRRWPIFHPKSKESKSYSGAVEQSCKAAN
jgi:hypothetical protein